MQARQNVPFFDGKEKPSPGGYSEWRDDCLKKHCFFLIEIWVIYCLVANGGEAVPSTLKGYIIGLQRFFRNEWGYEPFFLQGPIFNCK